MLNQSQKKEKKFSLKSQQVNKRIIKYVKSQPLTTQNTFQDLMNPNPEIKGRNIEIEDTYVEMESDSKIRKVKEPLQASYFKKSKPSQENQSPCK